MVVEVTLAHKAQVQVSTILICGTNMGKVELQDNLHSVNTLQSARARRQKLKFCGKYKVCNGLVSSKVHTVENTYAMNTQSNAD